MFEDREFPRWEEGQISLNPDVLKPRTLGRYYTVTLSFCVFF